MKEKIIFRIIITDSLPKTEINVGNYSIFDLTSKNNETFLKQLENNIKMGLQSEEHRNIIWQFTSVDSPKIEQLLFNKRLIFHFM